MTFFHGRSAHRCDVSPYRVDELLRSTWLGQILACSLAQPPSPIACLVSDAQNDDRDAGCASECAANINATNMNNRLGNTTRHA